MDKSAFRAAFPEFASATVYPDAMVTLWSGEAERGLSSDVCGTSYDMMVYLATAHYITLAAANVAAVTAGANPGDGGGGLVASEGMGPVSVSFDTNNTTVKGAEDWNQTTYGRQYFRKLRMLGSGAVQLY